MTKPGPIPNFDGQDLQVLTHLPQDRGLGFNSLWRILKSKGYSISYSTLSNTLKRLRAQGYIEYSIEETKRKIPHHLYRKTEQGAEYEQHLNYKLGLTMGEAKKIVNARRGELKYNQIILGEVPYTCEVEISPPPPSKNKEDEITRFIGAVGDTVISNIAENMNGAYSKFFNLLGRGYSEDALNHLRRALSFKLKLTLTFDGCKASMDPNLYKELHSSEEASAALQLVKNPSYTEILSCQIFSILNMIFSPERLPYDLSKVDGWSEMIADYSNKIRAGKGLPLLDKEIVKRYLQEQIDKGSISIMPVKVDSGIIQFHDKMEAEPEEFYSFMVGLTSNLRALFED
ncbi:MAG: PadR family transcriptional regulator [Candidatus Bathyarchaeia archaeon]